MCERVSPPPFIAWIGRLPRETNMGTLGTDIGMAVAIFPPKLGPVGARRGSADPGVRPTLGFGRPQGAASRTAFRPGHCQVGPHLVYVGGGALYVGFLCQMGPFCM